MNEFITINPDPTIRRISLKLQAMNYKHFKGMLTIQEPGDGSLFYTDEFIFGLGPYLGDKVKLSLLVKNEENMIPELVKALTPWFDIAYAKWLEHQPKKHKKREMYTINGVVKIVKLSMDCDESRCTCPGNEEKNERHPGQIPLSRLSK